MALNEAWNVLKSGNMPPPSPPYDPNDPDNPENDDTVMDNSRNYWIDSSKCPSCEQPRLGRDNTTSSYFNNPSTPCSTPGCPENPQTVRGDEWLGNNYPRRTPSQPSAEITEDDAPAWEKYLQDLLRRRKYRRLAGQLHEATRGLDPKMLDVLRNLPPLMGKKDLLPPENTPATKGPDYEKYRERQKALRRYMKDRFRED